MKKNDDIYKWSASEDVNITEITMSLKEIRGSIVISGLTLLPASAGVNVIDLRALEKLTGGDTYRGRWAENQKILQNLL